MAVYESYRLYVSPIVLLKTIAMQTMLRVFERGENKLIIERIIIDDPAGPSCRLA